MDYYRTKIKFESEDLLKDTDEYVPEYTAYLSCSGTKYEFGSIEIEYIEDEEGREVPLKLFSVMTISDILDTASLKDWDRVEPDYE